MQTSEQATLSTARSLREILIREVSPSAFRLLVEQALPVYLISEEYAGLPYKDRLSIMNAIVGLHAVLGDSLLNEEA